MYLLSQMRKHWHFETLEHTGSKWQGRKSAPAAGACSSGAESALQGEGTAGSEESGKLPWEVIPQFNPEEW